MAGLNKGIGIFTTGRSGSSMIAGIFAQHGVWHGKDRMQPSQWNMKGFFQNGVLHKAMKDHFGRDIEGEPLSPDPVWDARAWELLEELEATDPWFIKTGAFYYPAWQNLVDKNVLIYRPIEQIIESYQRCNFLPFNRYDVEFIVKRQLKMMDQLEGVRINTEKAVKGDFSELAAAFQYCGLEFDPLIAESFIDPDLYSI